MQSLYAFDRCEVRPAERQLLIDGKPAPLGARAFDLLVALIERRDRVVSKPELFDVGPGLVVEENNLQVQVSSLRKLLGPNAIATIRAAVPVRRCRSTRAPRTAPARRNAERNAQQPAAGRSRASIGRERALADCASLFEARGCSRSPASAAAARRDSRGSSRSGS